MTIMETAVKKLYAKVREIVDICREESAYYMVVLSQLRHNEISPPFRSTDLIAKTTGFDVVLDGHSHSVFSSDVAENKEGKVHLSSNGTGIDSMGQLVITANGNLRPA